MMFVAGLMDDPMKLEIEVTVRVARLPNSNIADADNILICNPLGWERGKSGRIDLSSLLLGFYGCFEY